MAELEASTISTIQCSDTTVKNDIVEQTQQMLQTVKSTPAESQSSVSNFMNWASSFLSDKYPLTTTTMTVYIAVITWADSYFSTSECDAVYQAVRWGILAVSLGYLTVMGYKATSKDGVFEFIRDFWMNWMVFTFMVMVMVTLPPVSCYTESVEYVTIAGIAGLVVMALATYIWDWIQSTEVDEKLLCEVTRKGKDGDADESTPLLIKIGGQ